MLDLSLQVLHAINLNTRLPLNTSFIKVGRKIQWIMRQLFFFVRSNRNAEQFQWMQHHRAEPFFNDIEGGENHLIHCRKVCDCPSFLRAKGEPPMAPMTKEDAENQAALDRQKRKDLRMKKRNARKLNALKKRKNAAREKKEPMEIVIVIFLL